MESQPETDTRIEALERELAKKNRDLEIEAALEKVRSRALAMNHSNELREVVAVVFDRLKELGFGLDDGAVAILIFSEFSKDHIQWIADPQGSFAASFKVPYSDHSIPADLFNGRESGMDFFSKLYPFEEKKNYFEHLFALEDYKRVPNPVKKMILESKHYGVSIAFEKHSAICISTNTGRLVSEDQREILKRFTKVFEQSYTRFLDLQRAEAQAKEAQIEAALEKIRSRSLAMQRSDELKDVVAVLFENLKELGLVFDGGAAIHLFSENSRDAVIWVVTSQLPAPICVDRPYDEAAFVNNPIILDVWKAKDTGEDMLNKTYSFEEKNKYFSYVFKYNDETIIPQPVREFILHADSYTATFIAEKNSLLGANSWSGQLFTQHDINILKRFARVFEQAYIRLLDLQKAEAQAREAQIEAALERVLARTMSMHRSEELAEIAGELFNQIKALGNKADRFAIDIVDEQHGICEVWMTSHEGQSLKSKFKGDLNERTVYKKLYDAWKQGLRSITISLEGDELKEWLHYVKEKMEAPVDEKYFNTRRFHNAAFFSRGWFMFSYSEPATKETLEILERFAPIFNLTYTRFLDLQKAEAQAREAKIEAALEKIRSHSLAMQRSNELKDVVAVLFEKLKELGLVFDGGAGIILFNENSRDAVIWVTSGISDPVCVNLPYDEAAFINNPIILDVWKAKDTGEHVSNKAYSFEEKNKYFRYVFKYNDETIIPQPVQQFVLHADSYTATFIAEKNSLLGANSYSGQLFTENEINVLKRMARVFEQAYVRFLDLQKAEAQAREAQIEAALERVRSVAMSMMKSEDLPVVCKAVFTQTQILGFTGVRYAQIYIRNDEEEKFLNYDYSDASGAAVVEVSYNSHPNTRRIYDIICRAGDDLIDNAIAEKDLDEWRAYLYDTLGQAHEDLLDKATELHYYLYSFGMGAFGICTFQSINTEQLDILKRFRNVFSLSYQRYADIALAEAQAREAIKRASVDRVRAEIASMRTTNDLERITPLIWNELTTLGVPFIRCGVFIMDEEQQQIETHLSTPEGKAIATFNLPYNAQGETAQILAHWYKKELYKQHWNETQFVEFTQNLVQHGRITSGKKYLTENHPTDLYLHFLPFLQGMLYVGNTEPLSDDALRLMQNLADAFSTAYTRYEDFNKLEAAKQQVEKTLVDLRQAQQQLIQSEKMASLGELTAGIAHEIQNPLNFVNNFSEVNKEMLQEMQTELKSGNVDEAINISNDIIDNEEKINHHGKRADAIVKGMLQHSRAGSGQKELTDINKLADEYLRLSYYGMRAKDKSLNAAFKTDFDETIEKLNVIPQDIGRVLLNLFNNAFFAVNERKKTADELYQPTVSVVTKKLNARPDDPLKRDKIEIIVKDNGNGIPQNIIDKIFQPFFTTKPSGQGTGLGLSLAYDIIKAHGGEIKVATKEGEGSEFIIILN